MYEYYKNKAQKYKYPDGGAVIYRFKRKVFFQLLDELENNEEVLLGIDLLKNASQNDYGEPVGFFGTDNISRDNFRNFIKKSYSLARDYVKKINDSNEEFYYEAIIDSSNLVDR